MDIILPRKRDKCNNMIGFVELSSQVAAQRMFEVMKGKKFKGNKLDLLLVQRVENKNDPYRPRKESKEEWNKF